jgi:acetyl-CoA synthetase
VLEDSSPPFFKWFVGGETNIVHNALDRHVKTYRKNKLALIWEGEPGDVRSYSYHALNREVCKFANVLRSLGVKKGDIVTIYMPRIPEQIIAMLACAKIGAPHSVVYGGFSVEALAERIEDAQSRVLSPPMAAGCGEKSCPSNRSPTRPSPASRPSKAALWSSEPARIFTWNRAGTTGTTT